MTEPATSLPPAGASGPSAPEDDEATTFLVAVATGGLGFLSIVTWAVLWLVQFFSDGETIALVQHRWWFLVAGVGLSVLGIGLQAHRIGEFFTQRRSLVALNVGLMSILAIVLTVLANYVGARHFKEFDWTHSGVYSISDESVQIASHLEKPLRCWVIWPATDENAETVRRLLDHYTAHSDKIEVISADPTADLVGFQAIVKKLDLEDRSFDDMAGVVIQSGYWDTDKGAKEWHADKSKHVSHRELFESSMDPMSGGRGQKKFKGEQVITNAIIEVTEAAKPKLYFLSGHREADYDGQNAQNPEELGFVTKLLRQKNYDVEKLDLLKREKRDVPEDCTVLIIANPKDKFDDGELSAIETYLKNGGRVFALMSVNKKANASKDKLVWAPTGLEQLLRRYNVECQDLEIGVLRSMGGGIATIAPECYVLTFDFESKITQPLASTGARAIFIDARPLKVTTENPHAKTVELAKSSDRNFAVNDLEEIAQAGAIQASDRKAWPVLVSVEQKLDPVAPAPDATGDKKAKERVARLIVAGDAHWVANPYADAGGFRNEALFFNCISWLVGQERFTKEPAKESNYKLDMDQGLVQVYSALSLVGMPLFAIVLGLSVWMIRRR